MAAETSGTVKTTAVSPPLLSPYSPVAPDGSGNFAGSRARAPFPRAPPVELRPGRVPSPAGTPAGALTFALAVGLAMTSALLLAELAGAAGGPPAEHALSTAVAAARPRIGMVRRAHFIGGLLRGQTAGQLARPWWAQGIVAGPAAACHDGNSAVSRTADREIGRYGAELPGEPRPAPGRRRANHDVPGTRPPVKDAPRGAGLGAVVARPGRLVVLAVAGRPGPVAEPRGTRRRAGRSGRSAPEDPGPHRTHDRLAPHRPGGPMAGGRGARLAERHPGTLAGRDRLRRTDRMVAGVGGDRARPGRHPVLGHAARR